MKSTRLAVAAAVLGLMVARGAGAQTILTYNIATAAYPASVPVATSASGLSATAISQGPGLSRPSFWNGTTGLFGATGFPVSSSPASNAYLQFSVTADPGMQITFGNLTYGLVGEIRSTGSNLVGPLNWDLTYSLNGFSTAGTLLTTVTVPDSGVSNTLNQKTFTTDVSAIGTRTGTVTFRLSGYGTANFTNFYVGGLGNGSGSGIGQNGDRSWAGTGSNVILTGSVSAVPEPSPLLAALGVLACIGVRRASRRGRH